MKMTVYMPDDLAGLVKVHSDINVSAICQGALRQEIVRREEVARLEDGMNRVVVHADGNVSRIPGYCISGGESADVAFYGAELYYSSRAPETRAYLTRRHQIAVWDNDASGLMVYESLRDLAASGYADADPALVAAVAKALGEEHVVELDI